MPDPTEGESQREYLDRCIPQLIREGKPQDQAAAICHSMWERRAVGKSDVATRFVEIKKTDAKKQLVYGEVYAPDTLDTQGDFMRADVIEQMAHDYMRQGLVRNIDTEHSLKKNGACVVESFVARAGDPDFKPGAWVLGVWMPREVYAKVERGEINGFSMYGKGERVPKVLEIEVPDDGVLEGRVMKADEDEHDHELMLKVDADGRLLGGKTTETAGHHHDVKRGTVTESAGERAHAHRFSMGDVLASTVAKMDGKT